MAERRNRGKKIEEIFDWLAQGKSSAEIREILEERRQQGQRGRERGEEREMQVVAALEKLDWVKKIKRFAWDSREDQEFKDMEVEIEGFVVLKVFVQVKSNDGGVIEFVEKVRRLLRGGSNADVDKWMRKKKLVILIGGEDEERIQRDFEAVLEGWWGKRK